MEINNGRENLQHNVEGEIVIRGLLWEFGSVGKGPTFSQCSGLDFSSMYHWY